MAPLASLFPYNLSLLATQHKPRAAPRANVLKLAVAARRGGPAGGTAVRLAGGQLDMAAPMLSSPTAA